jgi:hypothetical protein
MSRNFIKTGTQKGKMSREAQKRKRRRDAPKILAAQKAAEGKWGVLHLKAGYRVLTCRRDVSGHCCTWGIAALPEHWGGNEQAHTRATPSHITLGCGGAALKWLMLCWIHTVAKGIKKSNAATF